MLQSHAPQILPSPARLGLSNPTTTTTTTTTTSPSPNPNPNPKPSSSSQPPTTATPTSPALLSLLPPLPRAQSLLLQMSALATKLFEASPHRSLWLSSYRSSLPSFLPSSSSSSQPPLPLPSPSSTKDLLSLAPSLQTQLFEAVAQLQEILDLQDSTLKLSREIRSKDSALLSFARKLKDAEQLLDRLVDDYSDYRRPPKRAKPDDLDDTDCYASLHSNLDLNEVLAYAHKISYTTFAPPEHGAGLAPLRGALPPAPQDNEMRASQLYHFADLDVGVPRTAPEAKERAGADGLLEALMQPTPPREELLPAIPPPMLPIAVPPGWRKGMPVELPSELPPVPPGWKPGDPVPLPPLDGVGIGSKGEEQRMPVLPGMPVVPKAPEPIQVKYVELDINPDQDDYSSDYSSEGTSEEDDED